MKALLDTHTLLWLVDSPDKLPRKVTTLCENANNELFISIVSFWELSIKMSLGKIELEDNALVRLQNWCDQNAVTTLPISLSHCQRVQRLPFHHRDPFDRLIIAQGINDDLVVISIDTYFSEYDVKIIWK